jgi:hypothetical protein
VACHGDGGTGSAFESRLVAQRVDGIN